MVSHEIPRKRLLKQARSSNYVETHEDSSAPTVDEQNPVPAGSCIIPVFIRFLSIPTDVKLNFVHPQYDALPRQQKILKPLPSVNSPSPPLRLYRFATFVACLDSRAVQCIHEFLSKHNQGKDITPLSTWRDAKYLLAGHRRSSGQDSMTEDSQVMWVRRMNQEALNSRVPGIVSWGGIDDVRRLPAFFLGAKGQRVQKSPETCWEPDKSPPSESRVTKLDRDGSTREVDIQRAHACTT